MTSCREIRMHLSAYLDRELDAARRRDLDDHLGGCEPCRLLAGDLVDVDRRLLAAPVPPVTAGRTEALLASLRRELADEIEEPALWWAPLVALFSAPRWSIGLATGACLLLVVGLKTGSREGVGPVARVEGKAVVSDRLDGRPPAPPAPVVARVESAAGAAAAPARSLAGPPVRAGASPGPDPFHPIRTEIASLWDRIRKLEQEIDLFTMQARREGEARDHQLASRRVDEWR
jgi:anti-sigma factor RsiW